MAITGRDDDEIAIENLQETFRGALIQPEDPKLDDARTIWNAMIDRTPAVIAQCRGAADVIAAVDFAREQGLLVAVKGGGHNVAGNAICDDGLVIDLSLMTSIRVDLDAKRS